MPTIKPETVFLSRVNEKITRLNKLYKETIDLHNYYANELWEHFDLIGCCYAEETLCAFSAFVGDLSDCNIGCFKLVFEWVNNMSRQMIPVEEKYITQGYPSLGQVMKLINTKYEETEIVLSLGNKDVTNDIEKLICEWDMFISGYRMTASKLRRWLCDYIRKE